MEIWVCNEYEEPIFFANEEAARLDYRKWCEHDGEEFDEEIFKDCYRPLDKVYDIWTVEDVRKHGSFVL